MTNNVISNERLVREIETYENKIKQRLYKYLIRHNVTVNILDDAMQTARIRAFKFKHTFNTSQRFEYWFNTIAMNAVKDQMQEDNKHRCYSLDELTAPQADSAIIPMEFRNPNGTQDQVDQNHNLEELLEAINGLPDILRVPLYGYEIAGKSYEQLANELGVTPEILRVRIFRAKKILRQKLMKVKS
jgi:RNA polymerase sigma-70 factor (ECF subfamily)